MQTENNWTYTLIRLVAGIIIFPYGMQKLMGWFKDFGGGVGIKQSLESFKDKNVPIVVAWLVIIGQAFGSVMLIAGFFGRFVAFANFIIFTGALLTHRKDGWTMNWNNKKRGEGIEYFVLLLTFLCIILLEGSGAFSVDFWMLANDKVEPEGHIMNKKGIVKNDSTQR
ncbi:DoxX family protein [Flavobacterium sp. P21]|uniref:DoxX family protein n=1 Tax=Flavobacterium sp. P21 TaxID=3423948 RepID=UPI003D66F5D7